MQGATAGLLLFAVLVVFAIIVVAKSVTLIPQAEAAVIERLGRYSRTISGQLTLLIPFIDRVRARVDLRERVVSFPPQPVITEDNLTLNIDTVVYFQVTVPQAAVYEISNYIVGVEQLTTTTLRNVVGGMTLEQTLTSRDMINGQLRGVLDEATNRWGLRVARGERAATYLQAQGQAKAIEKTFAAIKAGRPTPEMLAYQYLQTLPQMARGDANKVWVVPSDFSAALQGFTKLLGTPGEDGVFRFEPAPVDEAPRHQADDDPEIAD